MKSLAKTFVLSSALVWVVVGSHTDARASGCGSDCVATCVVPTTASLGPSLSGTITVVVTNFVSSFGDVDATARLQWKGKERVYRQHLTHFLVSTAEDLVCRVLADGVFDDQTVSLAEVVGVSASAFKLNSRSVTGLNFSAVHGAGNTTASGIAEVTIYVVKP